MDTNDLTKKLDGLADNDMLSGADEPLMTIRKPSKPKKRKRFPCQFCRGVYVSLANLHKHVAAFHIPGNRQRASSEYSLICINCSRSFKYQASLRKHARTCVAMIRVDTDMDIAEEEPEAGVGTGCVVEGEPDGSPAGLSSDSEHHTNTAVPLNPTQSPVISEMDPGAEES